MAEETSPSAYEMARARLIVALDAPTADEALALADGLRDQCHWFKVGLELYVATGPSIVELLTARGHSVFLDLKLHDIPNTVAAAVRAAAKLGARMMTVHASGGPAMLQAAQEALSGVSAGSGGAMRLLAVTVLTSMDSEQLEASGHSRSPEDLVRHLATMGVAAGLRGFVCSALEIAAVRALAGPESVVVVPGIRPADGVGAAGADQKRVATPTAAIAAGANYLVVGRPITKAPDPQIAAEAILIEIAEALAIAPSY